MTTDEGTPLRPHFDLLTKGSVEEVTTRLEARFGEEHKRYAGHVVGTHVQLVIRRKQRNLSTPWLTFAVVDEGDWTSLRGRFGPHPSVWTLYMAAYGIVITLGLGLGFFGVSQWIAGLPAEGLWAFPVSGVLTAALYASAFIGQGFSGGDMEDMRAFVFDAVSELEPTWTHPLPDTDEDEAEEDFSPRRASD